MHMHGDAHRGGTAAAGSRGGFSAGRPLRRCTFVHRGHLGGGRCANNSARGRAECQGRGVAFGSGTECAMVCGLRRAPNGVGGGGAARSRGRVLRHGGRKPYLAAGAQKGGCRRAVRRSTCRRRRTPYRRIGFGLERRVPRRRTGCTTSWPGRKHGCQGGCPGRIWRGGSSRGCLVSGTPALLARSDRQIHFVGQAPGANTHEHAPRSCGSGSTVGGGCRPVLAGAEKTCSAGLADASRRRTARPASSPGRTSSRGARYFRPRPAQCNAGRMVVAHRRRLLEKPCVRPGA
mmetsp:Transcript_113169/g.320311  ORF Transcript_113169/g.320311 Transcript_113169/m.320311 type:complete len:290 (-) Transcript_113169:60-929(-)